MVVLGIFVNFENDCNFREKALDVESGEVRLGIENQPVGACGKWFANEEERLNAAVVIGPGMTQFGPAFIGVLRLEKYCYTRGGGAS